MVAYAPMGPSGPHPSLMTPFNSMSQGLTPVSLAAMGVSPPGAPGGMMEGAPGTGAAVGAPPSPLQSAMRGIGAVKPPSLPTPGAPGGGGASGNLDTGQLMALLKMFGGGAQGSQMPALGKLLGG